MSTFTDGEEVVGNSSGLHYKVLVSRPSSGMIVVERHSDGGYLVMRETAFSKIPPTVAECVRSLDVAVKCGADRGQYEVLVGDLVAAHKRETT